MDTSHGVGHMQERILTEPTGLTEIKLHWTLTQLTKQLDLQQKIGWASLTMIEDSVASFSRS